MPGTPGPNLGLVWGWASHEDGWGLGGFNPGFALLDAITFLSVKSAVLTAPPGSPAEGDRYIVAASATGAWIGRDQRLAIYRGGAWVFYTPKVSWRAFNEATSSYYRYGGTVWAEEVIARPLRAFGFGADPTALLTADQPVLYIKLPFGFTIPADFGDVQGTGTAVGGSALAAANVVLRVQRAAAATPLTFSDVGTITIGSGTAAVSNLNSSAADIVSARNDVLRVLAPTSPDTTFKGPFGSIVGYES